MNKLQIRAEVLSIIKNTQTINFQNTELLTQTVKRLEAIDDKKTLTDILVKEIYSSTKNAADILVFLLFSAVERQIIEEKLWSTLKDNEAPDAHKFIAISILKDIGTTVTYDALTEFVESKDEFIDFETQKLLETAVLNPEAQIDFLDFIFAIEEKDQKLLLDSLTDDFEGDVLANILTPVILSKPHSAVAEAAIIALEKTKSAYALNTLDWVVKNVKKDEIVSLAKKGMNILKLQGIRTLYSSKELHAGLLKYTKPHKCYVSIPDGNGNYGVIFSRIHENSNIQMFATVVNTQWGIVDCFGFNEITQNEFGNIIDKFYTWQDPIEIPFGEIKTLLSKAELAAIQKTNKLSYEYACWHVLLDDIEEKEVSYEFQTVELTTEHLSMLANSGLFDTWFIEYGDNEVFDEFIEKVTDFEKISGLFDRYLELIFDELVLKMYKNWMLLSAYFVKLMGREDIANVLYTLVFNDEYKGIFMREIFKKSIYEFYLSKRAQIQNIESNNNMFMKDEPDTDIETVNEMIEQIERAWINGESSCA